MIDQALNNRYHITALLGEGAMGEVYRATDTQTGQEVAVKVITQKLALDEEMLARFRREGEALHQLRHSNIVAFVDMFAVGKQQAIVMEYVPGGSLHNLIKHGLLPVDQAIRIALELSDALARAHHINIIHRDIKPENVLMAEDGTPKLTDFGVARLLSETHRLTGTGTQMGTPYYMSPEAWEGKPLDEQADIWSLGVVLFEMITGKVPFTGDTLVAVMNKVLTTPPPDLKTLRPDVQPALVKVIQRMLTRDKAKRYASMRQLAADLEEVLKGRGEGLETEGTTTKGEEPKKKERGALPAWAAGILVVVGLLVIGGLSLWAINGNHLVPTPSMVASETTIYGALTNMPSSPIQVTATLTPMRLGSTSEAAATPIPATRTNPLLTPTSNHTLGPILLQTDFEDGFVHGFDFYQGVWKVVTDETGNKVLEVRPSNGSANSSFGPHNFTDGIIEFRFRVTSGNGIMQLGIRNQGIDNKGDWTEYIVVYDSSSPGFRLVYQEKSGPWQPLEGVNGGGAIEKPSSAWMSLLVEAQGKNLTVSVDGNPITSGIDSRDSEGGLYLGTGFGNLVVQVDDVRVTEILQAPPVGATLTLPSPTPTEYSVTTPSPNIPGLGKLLFQEDFNGNFNQWPTGQEQGKTYYIDAGEYHLVGPQTATSDYYWLAPAGRSSQNYDNFYLEAKARYIEGTQTDDSYGVLFRYSNSSGPYVLMIGNDKQSYSLQADKPILPWTYSPRIIKNGANVIGLLCKGSMITIYINGYKVDSVESTYSASGGIGLDFASREHVAFDYIYLWALSP